MTTKIDAWQELMDRAYDKWQKNLGWSYRRFLLSLDTVERKAVLLGNFHYQTCNGGIQQWIDNGYASSGGKDVLTILEEMDTELSQRVAKIVRGVLQYVDLSADNIGFGEDYWLESWDDDNQPACYDEVDKLTDEYYEFYEEFVPEVEQYLRAAAVA